MEEADPPPNFLEDLNRAITDGDLQEWEPSTVPMTFDHVCPVCGILHGLDGLCANCQRTPGMAKAIRAWHAPLVDTKGHHITYAQAQEWTLYRKRGSYMEECRAIVTAANFD